MQNWRRLIFSADICPHLRRSFAQARRPGEKLNDYAALWLQHRPAAVEGSAIAPKIAL